VLNDAIELAELGFSVIWLKNKSKRPVGEDWTELPTASPKDLKATYIKGRNIGVRLGDPSRIDGFYLHVLDMDIRDPDFAEIAQENVKKLLETDISEFQMVISGSGGASRHLYFLTDRPYRSKKLWHTDEHFIGEDGKKHWAAEIELFGTGKQVALPPSIHPDTGIAYRWKDGKIPSPDAFPLIDGDVMDEISGYNDELYVLGDSEPLGISYEEAEAYLQNLDLPTWCDDRAGWVKVGMSLHHEFDAHPDAFKVWCDFSKQVPDRFNMRVAREQWRSFGKFKGQPVTFATMIEAANEVRYLAEWDGIADEFDDDEPADPDTYEDGSPLMSLRQVQRMFESEPKADLPVNTDKKRVPGVPDHLLTVPGMLGLAVDHYNATSTREQPQFAVQTALALGSITLGRYWTTPMDNFSSLYLVNLGVTGGGKEFARLFLSKTLSESGMPGLMGPASYASDSGIMGELAWKPRHVTVHDEFGRLLNSTANSTSTNMRDAQTTLMSMYGMLNGEMMPKAFSTNGKSKEQVESMRNSRVVRPAVTLLGLSTPETFFDALSQDDVANGFMNRLLIVNSRAKRKVEMPKRWKKIPQGLRKWIIKNGMPPESDEDFLTPENPVEVEEPTEVAFSDDAYAFIFKVAQIIADRQDALTEARLDGLWSRSQEITQRISLIVARSRGSMVIEAADVEWAWDYVSFYTAELIEEARDKLGANPLRVMAERIAKSIVRVEEAGLSAGSINDYHRDLKDLNERDHKEVMMRLERDLGIVKVSVRMKKAGGRPTILYMHKRFV